MSHRKYKRPEVNVIKKILVLMVIAKSTGTYRKSCRLWNQAKTAINQGKQLFIDRKKSILLADNADWGTVKVFNSGDTLGLDEGETKRWKEALKSRKSRPLNRERDSDSDHTFPPYNLPSTSQSRKKPSPQSHREQPICFKCHQREHLSYDCWRKDRY